VITWADARNPELPQFDLTIILMFAFQFSQESAHLSHDFGSFVTRKQSLTRFDSLHFDGP
jgi:hypothetical protein